MVDLFRLFPQRVRRILFHLNTGWEKQYRTAGENNTGKKLTGLLLWLLELLLLLLECCGIGEVYETVADLVKWNTRPLRAREIALARSVFGKTIDYRRVRLDDYAFIGPPQALICYVSFFHINSWRGMEAATLIHELMHVWQFQHLGLVYIPRALRAQFTEGYDYGGVNALREARRQGRRLLDFNYEQQADIIADYFRIRQGRRPRWGRAVAVDLEVYEYFRQQLFEEQEFY